MDFLKKNWSKIAISALLFLAGLVYVIALIQTDATIKPFEDHANLFAAVVFFWGMTAFFIAKMLEQDWAKYVLLAVGIIGTAFAVCGLINSLDGLNSMNKMLPAGHKITVFEWFAAYHAFSLLILFGLWPLIKGIKKLVGCCEGDKKTTAAPKAAAK